MPSLCSFEKENYPCFELNKAFVVISENSAAETVQMGKKQISGLLSTEEKERLAAGEPLMVPIILRPGRQQMLGIFPASNGYFAILCAAGEQNSRYLEFLDKNMRDVQALFCSLPLMEHYLDDSSAAQRVNKHIVEQCYRMMRTTTDQMWAAKIFSGAALEPVVLDMNDLLKALVGAVNTMMRGRGAPIFYHETEQPVCTVADRSLLELLICHLLNNSCTYTTDHNKVEVSLQVLKNRLVVHVRDFGKGMKPQVAEHVFEPYFSTDPYCDTDETPGAGMGMYLVRQGLRAMGGECALESEFGTGTNVSFTLPLSDDSTAVHTAQEDYLLDRSSCVYQHFVQLGGAF